MSDRIIKIHKRDNPYAQIDKDILRNENLSWRAKGLLAYLLSLPHDWKVYLTEITKHSTDGATSTRSAFKELRESGYVRKVSSRDDKGQITGWETIVYEVPILEVKSADSGESTLSKTLDVGNLHSGETHTTNKDCTNNEKSNDNDLIYISEFENWFKEYLNKKGKSNSKKYWVKLRKENVSVEQLTLARDNYNADIKKNDTQPKFIMMCSTFLGPSKRWEDFLNTATEDNKYGFLNLGKFNKCNDIELPDDLPDM